MYALSFLFAINQSFLSHPGHPITVPRGQVDYKLLEAERLNEGPFTVIFPKGERVTAKMHDGVSSWGRYYQLRFIGLNRGVPNYVREQVHVLLARMGGENYAIIEEATR